MEGARAGLRVAHERDTATLASGTSRGSLRVFQCAALMADRPWIRTIAADEATGDLRRSYDAAIARAGRVYGILRAMSIAPAVLDASIGLYRQVMYGHGGLTRRQREMLAVVVSSKNSCHY